MRQFTKRSAAIITGSVLAVAGGTAAFAYASGWFQGDSTTYAQSSTIGNITAHIDLRTEPNAADNKFYPNKVVELKNVLVTNPNDYKVKITSVGDITVTNAPGCSQNEAGFSFTELHTATVFNKGANAAVDLGDLKMSENASPACANQGGLIITAVLNGEVAP